ncbi:MAG: hypothetical protein P1U68_04750 [Verrucomicrobiales bacterium]|nr:hypothetical protein [Verrucomicrobiales bacterium]
MKDDTSSISNETLRATLGDLTDEEIIQLREELSGESIDSQTDIKVDGILHLVAAASKKEVTPPLPEGVRESLEAARVQAESDAQGGETETGIYSVPKRYDPQRKEREGRGNWHSAGVIAAGLAIAASVAVAFVTYVRPVNHSIPVSFAEAVSLLTPGEETSFLEPVFTWEVDNGGVVEIEISTSDGVRIASLDRAFSPLRWSSLRHEASLEPGVEYEMKLSTREGELASSRFRTASAASGAPLPAGSIDEIVAQCEGYLAANRPADAWMLWGELTAAEKSDPRMQVLKEQILAVITG